MNRKFLEDLGLEKDAIDKIMAEHGKTVTAEQDKTKTITQERDTLQTQLEDANKEIKGYKDMDIEAIKKSANDWEAKANANAEELQQVRNESALEKALLATNTIDAELLNKALDHENLKYQDDKIIGLNEQIEQLVIDKPYLFKATEPEAEGNNDNGFNPYVPRASGADPASTMETQINDIFGF